MKMLYIFLLFLLNVVFGGKYPDGPDVDSHPIITSYKDPLPTAFYIILGFSIGYLLVYGIFRLVWEQFFANRGTAKLGVSLELQTMESGGTAIPAENEKRDPASGREDVLSTAIRLDLVEKFTTQGYQDWIPGKIGAFALFLYCAWIFTLFILILFDVYWGCQTGGLDNQCYYGTFPITGGDQFRRKFVARFFFYYWWVTLGSLVLLLVLRDYIWNFFRITSNMQSADWIYVWVKDEEEVLCGDPTIFVVWSRYIMTTITEFLDMTEFGHCETVPTQHMTIEGVDYTYIEYEFTRYIVRNNQLHTVHIDLSDNICDIPKMATGVDNQTANDRLKLIGYNEIGYRIDNLWELLAGEFFSFFYLYQWQIYLVWFYWAYLFTALAEYAVVLFSASLNMALKRFNQTTIAKLTAFSSKEKVYRSINKGEKAQWQEIDGRELVPGDIIQVQSQKIVPCDIVLLDGIAVIDEAGLTGESMPISKVPATEDSDKIYGEHGSSRYTLFAGTTVLQAGSSEDDIVTGVVMRTGIHTEKGTLVAHILHPSKMTFKYDEEYVIAFLILLTYGIFGLIMTLVLTEAAGSNAYWVTRFNKGIFTMSQMLSPLLPLSLSVGQAASSTRLNREMNIFCVNPKRIAIAGKIRLSAFDKTGTLTKEGLDFLGSVPVVVDGTGDIALGDKTNQVDDDVKAALATCHAVTKFKDDFVGNQVEVKMFASTGWDLIEEQGQLPVVEGDGKRIVIPRRFEFDHARMTMSVITESQDLGRMVFCKGAYEKIVDLCVPESLPKEFLQEAERWAKDGCYVLGLCCKAIDATLDIRDLTRDDIEAKQSMKCLGLILFRNELKDDTRKAITQLKNGDVRCIMITGDNAQCGYYIAKASNMIRDDARVYLADEDRTQPGIVLWKRQDLGSTEEPEEYHNLPDNIRNDAEVELAITGKAMAIFVKEGKLDDLILKTRIYARTSPNQKTDVITRLIKKGIVCGYCGDGGNDCGALRAAHAGLALSEAEASVVAPFTGKDKSVMGMVNLLREGRCALATSFSCWKFIITFGQAYIICKLSCVYVDAIMPSIDYLFIDIVVLVSISFGLTLSRPLDDLGKDRPTASLLGYNTVGSIGGITFFNFIFIIISWAMITSHEEYRKWPIKCEDGDSWWLLGDNWEAFNAFNNFIFQIFTAGFVFGFGSRFRKPIWENWLLCVIIFGGYLMFMLCLLLGENGLTKIFHFPQTNYNRHGTESTTWGFYQNVNENGLPFFGEEMGCAAYAVHPSHPWNSLYETMEYCYATQNAIDPEAEYYVMHATKDGADSAFIYAPGCTVHGNSIPASPAHDSVLLVDSSLVFTSAVNMSTGSITTYTTEPLVDTMDTNETHNVYYFGIESSYIAKGDYRPGNEAAFAYDVCNSGACITAHPGCKCGWENESTPKNQDNAYDMDSTLRFELFLVVFFNSITSIVWIWQGVDGVGREYLRKDKPNYIHLDF